MTLFSSNGKKGQSRPAAQGNRQPGLSVITSDLRVEGELHATGDIRIEGKVKGNLRIDGEVIVANGGWVEGDVHAKESVIAGQVHGSIVGHERVELQATAMVRGNLTAPKLVIQEGGVVVGRLRVGETNAPQQEHPSERPGLVPIRPAPHVEPAVAVG